MLTKSKAALAFVLVLGSASAALAAPKHQPHQHPVTVQSTGAYQSYGSARVNEPANIRIQDQGLRAVVGG